MTDFLQVGMLIYGAPILGLALMAGSFGLPVPSSMMLIAAGVFSRQGSMEWYYAAALGLLGAVLGDSLSFALGRWGGNRITKRYGDSKVWVKAQSSFEKGSGLAVFFSRFLLTTFAVPVNLMAGSSSLRFRTFLFYVILGEAMWIILYGGAGYLFSNPWVLVNAVLGYAGAIALVLMAASTIFLIWRLKRTGRIILSYQFVKIPFKRRY